MRIAIATKYGQGYGLSCHLRNGFLTDKPVEADITILDDPSLSVNGKSGIVINQSRAMQNLNRDEGMRKELMGLIGIREADPVSTLYGLFNGERFSQMLEISQAGRLMNGQVGPEIGFAYGVALKIEADPEDAIRGFGRLIDFLRGLGYKGEVGVMVDDSFGITGVLLQHIPAHFALYREVAAKNVQHLVEFAAGTKPVCELNNHVGMAVLVSQYPYPVVTGQADGRPIAAPPQAEPHLWRLRAGEQEMVLVTARSNGEQVGALREARKRVYRTIGRMDQMHGSLQYRTDAGRFLKFILAKDKHEEVDADNKWKNSA